jgi:hypothetical protein
MAFPKIPKSLRTLFFEFLKGLFLSLMYLTLTEADDTNIQNILVFSVSYVVLLNSAKFVTIDPNFVTNAFITKTIFTLIDQRVNKKNKHEEEMIH